MEQVLKEKQNMIIVYRVENVRYINADCILMVASVSGRSFDVILWRVVTFSPSNVYIQVCGDHRRLK